MSRERRTTDPHVDAHETLPDYLCAERVLTHLSVGSEEDALARARMLELVREHAEMAAGKLGWQRLTESDTAYSWTSCRISLASKQDQDRKWMELDATAIGNGQFIHIKYKKDNWPHDEVDKDTGIYIKEELVDSKPVIVLGVVVKDVPYTTDDPKENWLLEYFDPETRLSDVLEIEQKRGASDPNEAARFFYIRLRILNTSPRMFEVVLLGG